MLIAYADMLCCCKVCITLCISFIWDQTHTRITDTGILPHKMSVRRRSGVTEAQTENEDQPQLATTAEIVELRQVVQQRAKLKQKQAEEARSRKEELTLHQNQLFEAFMQMFPISQGENKPGPVVEYV